MMPQSSPQPAPANVREGLPERTGRMAYGVNHLLPMGAYHYAGNPLQRGEAAAVSRSGLPDDLKAGIEGLSGLALDQVKVHYNSARPAQLQAHAYAQGSDIHLAPGQERRLPHEAWHLVQQAQGRVAASMQDKGVALNDDCRLEREADVMGARAMRLAAPAQRQQHAAPAAAADATPVTQLYRIEREPVTQQVYSVSNDNSMVTGMTTPNHEFYVERAPQIGAMNNAISASPLQFYSAGKASLFERDYYRVGLSFDTGRVRGGAPDDRRAPRQDNLQALYRDQVLPEIRAFRQGRRAGKTAEIDAAAVASEGQVNPAFINPALAFSVRRLELFKKLILSQLSQASYRDDETGAIDDAGRIVATLESVLYSTDITRGAVTARLEQLAPYFREEENPARFARTPILRTTLLELHGGVAALAAALPVDLPVDLMSFHNASFQARQVEAVDGPDNVLLYRACDVTASTLLGNKITEQNAQRLKTYVAGTGGAFHYATKILQSGGDWVTLEGFAASDRERNIIGIDDDAAKNVDDTWQYIMYGALAGDGDPLLSDEDRYFALYTKLRYYLKGIAAPGVFGSEQRDKLMPKPVGAWRLQPLFPVAKGIGGYLSRLVTYTPQQKAEALLKQLQEVGLLDKQGCVANRGTLTLQLVRKLLPNLPEGTTVKIFRILRDSLQSQHIQIGLGSDLSNAIAWRAYLRAGGDEQVALLTQQADAITEQRIDPRAQSAATWDDLAQTVAGLPPRSVIEPEPPVLGLHAKTSLTASEPLKASKPVKDQSAPKGKQPPARHELVALGLRELDRLRDLWRSRQPQPALGSPPNYLDWRAAIQSIPLAPEDMPIGAIQEDLMQWLSHAREKWGV
ncbi:DUF4157 domain-containing protein [Collimonas sp. OK412]|uniref:eCIS core domain-containing protein n=1 Tax=Collimonas sp. (strain OK412) TaxID=1801619 RepID=UPI0008F20CC1|nr:DUF4157 domain-containing protein [Collimonas sp. OK412]SFB76671.1 protein of unknown function [Collimonas sp. OK412]